MLIFRLAWRNLLNAGLRTWLNVAALSFAFVAIVFLQGFYQGLNDQVERASVDAIDGGGQYWHAQYNPLDPLTLDDAHGIIPAPLDSLAASQRAVPILIRRGSIYPQGRFRSILIKGIPTTQHTLTIPSRLLTGAPGDLPGLIGSRMAHSTGLKKGDIVTVQWRDAHGTFDARDVTITEIFRSQVQEIDNDQIWIPLVQLQQLARMPGEATLIVVDRSVVRSEAVAGWEFKDLGFLLQDLRALVKMKTVQASILYLLLMFLAMLAIFDTQVLSIWRRRKEMGTLMALGMTRGSVIALFTVEGALHGVFAAMVAAAYGIPLMAFAASVGMELPNAMDSAGFAIGERLFPIYTPSLVIGTALLVFVVTTIVSYLPTRRITHLSPTDALRGKAL